MRKWTVLLLLSLLGASCTVSSGYMRPGATRPTEPPPGMALVYVLRPSSFGSAIDFQVWDGERLIGVSLAKKCFSYACPPGKHFFMFLAENNLAIEADLSAGKTYYIAAGARMGWWKARAAIQPVIPGSEYWDQAPVLAQTLAYEEPIADLLAKYQAGRQEHARTIMAELKGLGEGYVQHLPSDAGR